MFLSYAVVPVLVFTVLLNFFYLYAPIDSKFVVGMSSTNCNDCLKSPCHTNNKGPCVVDPYDSTTFACFTCEPDPNGEVQYYCEEKCTSACTDPKKKCVCDCACWSCIATEGVDLSQYECYNITQAVDDQCKVVPYEPTS